MKDYSELKRLAMELDGSEWLLIDGDNSIDSDNRFVTSKQRIDDNKVAFAEINYGHPDAGMSEPFQSQQVAAGEFIAAANPAAMLALIAEVEGLRAQHGRDSKELRSLCQARDDARKDRDQLKEEVERSTEREIMQLAEIEALRRDAERYRFLRQDISNNVQDFCIVKKRWSATFPDRILELDGADAEIDAAMSNKE